MKIRFINSFVGLILVLNSFLIGAYLGMYLESAKGSGFLSPDPRQSLTMMYFSILLGFSTFIVGASKVNRIVSNAIQLLAIIWIVLAYKVLLWEGYYRLVEERFININLFFVEFIAFVLTITCLATISMNSMRIKRQEHALRQF